MGEKTDNQTDTTPPQPPAAQQATNSQPEPQTPATTPQKQFLHTLIDELPHAKAIQGFIYREGKAVWNGWIVFGIIAAIVAWFAFSKGYDFGAKKLESVQGELKDAKQDRDKYQMMLAPFQAMAMQIYTNVPIDKRLEHLTAQFSSTSSNLLAALDADKPVFELYIQNTLITNHSVISLKESRQLEMVIQNVSLVTADGLSVDLETPTGVTPTNIVFGADWRIQPPTRGLSNGSFLTNFYAYHWAFKAYAPLASNGAQEVNPIVFSTNMSYHKPPAINSITTTGYGYRLGCLGIGLWQPVLPEGSAQMRSRSESAELGTR